MRLEALRTGHRPLQRLQLGLMKAMLGGVPGPVAVCSYRREWFGRHFAAYTQQAMRRATEWTVGEVELFAAFVSKKNKCQF